MANEMREHAPVNITLGSLYNLYSGDKKTDVNSAEIDRELLGDELCNVLYFSPKNGQPIADGSSSIAKIRKCVNAKQTNAYDQSYTAFLRIVEHYFISEENSDGSEDKKNKLVDDIEKKRSAVASLRTIILNAWKKRLLRPMPDYEDIISNYLKDATLKDSTANAVVKIREFLSEYKLAVNDDDKAETLTILTFLSISRCYWEKLPYANILPEKYKTREQLRDTTDIEISYQEGRNYFFEGKYPEALNKLENLEQSKLDIFDTEEALNRFNGNLYLLRSKVRRHIMQHCIDIDVQPDDISYDLDGAVLAGNTEAMLIVARERYEERPDSVFEEDKKECIALCKGILEKYPDAFECGEAAWMLYLLEDDDAIAEQYLKKAAYYSYEKAVKVYKEKNSVSITGEIEKSADPTTGFYSVNDENTYSEMIQLSAPKSWEKIPFPITQISFSCDNDGIWSNMSGYSGRQRYFLISNDFQRNLQELLHILQAIKTKQTDCYEFAFYIRGCEEKMTPFIDTALARIEDKIIPVYILDDDKQSARVFAQHPLFYPIRKLKQNEAAMLKLAVIGNSKVCEWLIREAFWMMTFRNPKVQTSIEVISPLVSTIVDSIKYKCPDIDITKIKQSRCPYESSDFLTQIDSILEGEYTYFAIDIGSDIDNMELALKIRERSIRKKIQNDNEEFNNLPIIAFHCKNPDIANLSHRTVVINENLGNRWFNNYSIIPFGRIDHHYHWDSLTDHILEQLSLNAHLQYYLQDGVDEETTDEELKKKYFDGLKDYYGRTYNRDSSMAVAMGLPYRLYQAGKRILPTEPINILDPDTFYSADALQSYADWVKKIDWENSPYTKTYSHTKQNDFKTWEEEVTIFDSDSEIYQMADWEQARWNRFMISRGWTTATSKQMKLYFEQGNPRQQLYIGKMHPCIEDYDKLEKTNEKWIEISGKDKGFHMSNITSIQRTERILTKYWMGLGQRLNNNSKEKTEERD